jgi:hypothetical protein
LTGLKAGIHFVDNIKATPAANNAVGPVALGKRFQGITDFHLTGLS